jgi:hypothetical protein
MKGTTPDRRRDWLLEPVGTVREIFGNNRRAGYLLIVAVVILHLTGNLPAVEIPTWWPVAVVAILSAGLAGYWAAKKILDLLPSPEGIYIVEFDAADTGGGAIYELSEEAFEDMRVLGGDLYQWDESPKRVYEVRHYDRSHNVALANWRETKPASALAAPPTVDDALAAVRELREELEPEVAKARETRRRVRGIVRKLDSERAEAQQAVLDDHVAPDLGDDRTISEIVEDEIPDDLHPEAVDVEHAIENGDGSKDADGEPEKGEEDAEETEGGPSPDMMQFAEEMGVGL